MKIGALERFSLIEYPGKLSAIVFTQGCNFHCPFCHNPELVLPEQFRQSIPEEEVLAFLATRLGKLDAVSITGGEPTLHDDLPRFIKRIKRLGFYVKLDTNGSNPDMLADLLRDKLLDYVAMDLKAPLAKYGLLTNAPVNLDNIRRSVDLIRASGVESEFRTTLVSNLLNKDDLVQLRHDFGDLPKYFLQNFTPTKTLDANFPRNAAFTAEALKQTKKALTGLISGLVVR